MGPEDGRVIGLETVLETGHSKFKYTIVLVAEGYTRDELDIFRRDTEHFADVLFSYSPFRESMCSINIYRLVVESAESGADILPECNDGKTVEVRTYFDAYFPDTSVCRYLMVSGVLNEVESVMPYWNKILVIVNSDRYGGRGGSIATFSKAESHWEGAPIDWADIMVHELGHGFGLADEYMYFFGCDLDGPENDNWDPKLSLNRPNVDCDTINRAITRDTVKWSDLILDSTPIPTKVNNDCSKCDYTGSPVDDGVIGIFEGAYYHHCGVYRSEYNCAMNRGTVDGGEGRFCTVCQRHIEKELEVYASRDENMCYAPTFDPLTSIQIATLKLFFPIIILILIFLIPIKGSCPLLQYLFYLKYARVGNSRRCIVLSFNNLKTRIPEKILAPSGKFEETYRPIVQ